MGVASNIIFEIMKVILAITFVMMEVNASDDCATTLTIYGVAAGKDISCRVADNDESGCACLTTGNAVFPAGQCKWNATGIGRACEPDPAYTPSGDSGSGTSDTDSGSGTVKCMQAVSAGVADDGTGGTVEETTIATCTADATIASGNKGTMCTKTSYRDADENKNLGLSQGCDLGECTAERACCTGIAGVKHICVATNIMSGVPKDDEFSDCTQTCTTTKAASSTVTKTMDMLITALLCALLTAGL